MEAVIAIGIFAGVVLPIGFAWYREARGHRQQAVLAAQEGAKATGLAAQLADMTNRFNNEKERADAIEDAWVAAAADEPVAGAADRLLAKLAAARAAHRDGSRVVHSDGAAAEPHRGDTELLRPGE